MTSCTAEPRRSTLLSQWKRGMRCFASVLCLKVHNLSRAHVVLKCVSQVTHWSWGWVEKYNWPMSNCTKGWPADGGLLVNFHKHAKKAAWHQRNNNRTLLSHGTPWPIHIQYNTSQRRETTVRDQASSQQTSLLCKWLAKVLQCFGSERSEIVPRQQQTSCRKYDEMSSNDWMKCYIFIQISELHVG